MKNHTISPTIWQRLLIFVLLFGSEIPISFGIMLIVALICNYLNINIPETDKISGALLGGTCIFIGNLICYFVIRKLFKIESHIEISLKLLLIAILLMNYVSASAVSLKKWGEELAWGFGAYYLTAFFEFVGIILIIKFFEYHKSKKTH